MSQSLQARFGESEAASAADPATPDVRQAAGTDDPLQLLRSAINRLNSSPGEPQDQTQMANLLAELQQALDRANTINRALEKSGESVAQAKFADALKTLDEVLVTYPDHPALLDRRRDVEERRTAFARATTVRAVLEEAQWLVQQDRLDLAVHLLKEKVAALPDQPDLVTRLNEVELLLPQWEQDRQVHAALERVAALEERQQWQVALAIVEDTLQSYSASGELTEAARRVRDRLEHNDRQSRLERRLQLIGQKIASRSWKQALTLVETTRKEFPDAAELTPLQREVDAGLRREECEAIVLEVRQCLADGELEPAEQVLQRGLDSLGQEPALDEVRWQLEAEKKYRSQLRAAQAFFGRHQLQEAERILTELAAHNRPEAVALLDAVRQARAVTEEENFCERGREKALELMQQEQYTQAADLLDNLRSLFPGDPILERDLMVARAAMAMATPAVTPEKVGEAKFGEAKSGEEKVEEAKSGRGQADETQSEQAKHEQAKHEQAKHEEAKVAVPAREPARREEPTREAAKRRESGSNERKFQEAWSPAPTPQIAAPSLFRDDTDTEDRPADKRWIVIVGAAALVVVSVAGIWKFSRNDPPSSGHAASAVSQPSGGPRSTPTASALPSPGAPEASRKSPPKPPPNPSPAIRTTTANDPKTDDTKPASNDPKPAAPAARTVRTFVQLPPVQKGQGATLAAPVETEPLVSAQSTPAGLANPLNVTPSLPAAQTRPAAPTAASQSAPANAYQEAQLIYHTQPTYPAAARNRGISGVVRLQATVDERGNVKGMKILSGDMALSQAATQAVSSWQYKPATLSGKPVASTVIIQVIFGDSK